MTEEAIVRLIVLAIQAVPPIASAVLGVLRPDVAQSVREQLSAARATMAAAPSPTPDVEAMVARAKAASRPSRISAHHADVLRRLLRPTSGALLSHEERDALATIEEHVRLVTADTEVPPVLEVPPAPWSEPGGTED
jgi:hypothetical protein